MNLSSQGDQKLQNRNENEFSGHLEGRGTREGRHYRSTSTPHIRYNPQNDRKGNENNNSNNKAMANSQPMV